MFEGVPFWLFVNRSSIADFMIMIISSCDFWWKILKGRFIENTTLGHIGLDLVSRNNVEFFHLHSNKNNSYHAIIFMPYCWKPNMTL